MNVNDLALFRGLDVAVRKLRRGAGNTFDKEKLVADVLKAVAEYPSEKLETMWSLTWRQWKHAMVATTTHATAHRGPEEG